MLGCCTLLLLVCSLLFDCCWLDRCWFCLLLWSVGPLKKIQKDNKAHHQKCPAAQPKPNQAKKLFFWVRPAVRIHDPMLSMIGVLLFVWFVLFGKMSGWNDGCMVSLETCLLLVDSKLKAPARRLDLLMWCEWGVGEGDWCGVGDDHTLHICPHAIAMDWLSTVA